MSKLLHDRVKAWYAAGKPMVKVKRRKKAKDRSKLLPTHPQGKAAQTDLITRAPIFYKGSIRRKLFYYDYQKSISGAAGIYSQANWIANGLYDPDITGSGHQPLGFDQMMTLYEQYLVVASKITVNAMNTGADAVKFGVLVNPDTSAPSSIVAGIENGLIKTVILGGVTSTAADLIQTQKQFGKLNHQLDIASYFGHKTQREMLSDSTLSGNSGANPTEGAYYTVFAFGVMSNTTYEVKFDVLIEFDAIFWEPKKLAAS